MLSLSTNFVPRLSANLRLLIYPQHPVPYAYMVFRAVCSKFFRFSAWSSMKMNWL